MSQVFITLHEQHAGVGGTLSAPGVMEEGRVPALQAINLSRGSAAFFFISKQDTCLLLVSALIESAPGRSVGAVAFPSARGECFLFADNCTKTSARAGYLSPPSRTTVQRARGEESRSGGPPLCKQVVLIVALSLARRCAQSKQL